MRQVRLLDDADPQVARAPGGRAEHGVQGEDDVEAAPELGGQLRPPAVPVDVVEGVLFDGHLVQLARTCEWHAFDGRDSWPLPGAPVRAAGALGQVDGQDPVAVGCERGGEVGDDALAVDALELHDESREFGIGAGGGPAGVAQLEGLGVGAVRADERAGAGLTGGGAVLGHDTCFLEPEPHAFRPGCVCCAGRGNRGRARLPDRAGGTLIGYAPRTAWVRGLDRGVRLLPGRHRTGRRALVAPRTPDIT